MFSSWWIPVIVMDTVVRAGIIQSLYTRGLSGILGLRVQTPYESLADSRMHALRYGSFSSCTQSNCCETSGIALKSSSRSFLYIRGVLMIWKVPVQSAQETVSIPAPIIDCASSARNLAVLYSGGRSLSSTSSKTVRWKEVLSSCSSLLIIDLILFAISFIKCC